MEKEKVTLTLPKEVMDAIRREANPRGYGSFITEAVTYFLEERERAALRERLIEGYQATAKEDQLLAEEWRSLEEESWNQADEPVQGQGQLP
jgi:Arc/MetJ-type ribon-helix-helix transcriptional regulator